MGKFKSILILLPALFLAGCCVDEYGNVVIGKCEINTTTNAAFQCNGASCGNSLSSYNGTNVNVWTYKNSGNSNVNLNVSMANISNKEITIVYTNEGSSYVTMPFISINNALKNEIYPYGKNEETFDYLPNAVLDFEPAELIEETDDLKLNQTPSYAVWNEGNKRNWNVAYGSTVRTTTLRKQLTINERVINLWVEDSEYTNGRMDTAKIDYVVSYISTVYTNVVKVAGEPWGAHKYSNLIASGNQPLDIVFFNSGNSIGGYFATSNNYKKSTHSNSNEAVAIFIDTRMDRGYTTSVIAHELTHAIDFYQRYVVMGDGSQFSAFLGEMRAVMMEDIMSSKIPYNSASGRYGSWITAPLYQQDFSDWKYSDPTSYTVASSFGSFLLRQYGIDFFKTLFKTRSDLSTSDYRAKEINVLDKAIKVYDSGGLAKALRHWGASIAIFPVSTAPKGFGYPARSNDNGFNLESFDGNIYRKLPTSSLSTLAPNAHFPFLRKTTNNIYNESFVIPKGVGVSIVVK
ncbi:MAG: hypothetical protein LBK93_00090 [Rickettsiales bacterium]|jgi:hypothetical protein|nr:hypothetical protein [Rickettsiales bacterium]